MQVDEFVRITDNTYTRAEVLQMEEHILDVLDFELTQPTSKTFVRRFVQASNCTECLLRCCVAEYIYTPHHNVCTHA